MLKYRESKAFTRNSSLKIEGEGRCPDNSGMITKNSVYTGSLH